MLGPFTSNPQQVKKNFLGGTGKFQDPPLEISRTRPVILCPLENSRTPPWKFQDPTSHKVLDISEIRCRKVPSEKCTDVPVEKCQQVPEQKCTEVGIILFWVSFIAILYRLLSRSAGTSPRNIALRKWLVSSYDCRLLTSISFLQEHVQKRICSKATKKVTKRVLPKAEAPKQALPKEEAINKVLPKATEAIRKVLSKASHSYKWWRREDCYTHDKFLLQPYLWNITKLLCSFLSCHWR